MKPTAEGGLGWGTLWATVGLAALLLCLILFAVPRLRRHPMELLPAPTHRVTGQAQVPNGELVAASATVLADNGEVMRAVHSPHSGGSQPAPDGSLEVGAVTDNTASRLSSRPEQEKPTLPERSVSTQKNRRRE